MHMQIKPLTEEEKKQKLAELREKMGEKRARKAAEDAKEAKANEAIRRKGGKVREIVLLQRLCITRCYKEMGNIKEEMKAKEAIKAAEQARKGQLRRPIHFVRLYLKLRTTDKIEDAKARAAVKAQIEADRKARAEKAAREKALREGTLNAEAAAVPSTSAAATPQTAVAGKDYKETRLQIRLATGGQPYTTTLPSDASELPAGNL